jgi:hypothetical protein
VNKIATTQKKKKGSMMKGAVGLGGLALLGGAVLWTLSQMSPVTNDETAAGTKDAWLDYSEMAGISYKYKISNPDRPDITGWYNLKYGQAFFRALTNREKSAIQMLKIAPQINMASSAQEVFDIYNAADPYGELDVDLGDVSTRIESDIRY